MTEVTKIDNGADVVTIDAKAPDARSQMLASAASIASTVIDVEGKLAETAKAWGQSLFRAVYADKSADMDSLIGDSKVAAGWTTLASTDASKKAKARLEVYFSNARLVAENWARLTDKQADVLAGLTSIHYLANQLRNEARDAKKALDKAAALAKAEADAKAAAQGAEESKDAVNVPEPTAPTLAEMADAFAIAYGDATPEERAACADAIALIVATFNGDCDTDAEISVPTLAQAA
jgi:hypothetical protein